LARSTTAVAIASLPTLCASAAGAPTDLCGATIVEDLVLDQDLVCPAGGLIIGADGVKINLQGHSVTGSGAGAGIQIVGRMDVTVFGGTIANFLAGVVTNNSADVVIKDNTFRDNADGVDVQSGSTGITIKANVFLNSRGRGIMLRGGVADADIKANTFAGNRVGVLLFAPVGATVKDNTVAASLEIGIRIRFTATGNLVLNNSIVSNPIGIDFLPGPAGGPTGNSVRDNTISLNTCGIKGPYGGNTLQDNQFIANTTDICT
jgi:parallel beta-helix repeat protein